MVERVQRETSEPPCASRRRGALNSRRPIAPLLTPWLSITHSISLHPLSPVQHSPKMQDMHVDTVVNLPGGDMYEDVTDVFAEAAKGASCASYIRATSLIQDLVY